MHRPTRLRTDDPFLAPHRWLVRLGSRFYYPIAAVAVTLVIGIVVRDALGGDEYLLQLRRLADLTLIGGMCVLVLFWRAERMWLRGRVNWLVRFTRPDLAFLWSGLSVIVIAVGMIALILIAPTSTVANHLWPLFLFPLLFLAERGDTVPFLYILGLTCFVLFIFRLTVSNSLSGVLTPPLWLAILATSNYYLARRHLLLELRTDILREIAHQFSTVPDVEKSFEAITETIGRRLRHDHLRLWLLDEARERLVLHAAWGTPQKQWQGLSLPLEGSLPGAVVRSGQLESWDDVKQRPHHASPPPFEWVVSALAVPIRAAGQTVGVLEALGRAQAEFWELDAEHLALMADSIGIALARSQHVQREAERLRDTLWRAVTQLNDCTSIQEMFDTIAREAQAHLGADLVVLYQLAPGTGFPLTPPLFMGDFRDAEALRQPQIPEDSVLFELVEKWAPFYSAEAQIDPILSRGRLVVEEAPPAAGDVIESGLNLPYGKRNRFILRENVRSAAFLPLGTRSERVGALFLHYRTRREFSPLDQLTLEAFASLVAEQINRARVHWRKYEAFGGVLFGVHGPLTLSADSLRRLTGAAREVLRADPATAEAALDQAQKVARKLELAAMLTRLSQRDELDATGLADELRRAAAKALQFIEPNCRVYADIPDEADDLPFEVLDAIYCLAIESIVNAAYHGHAQRIDIGLELAPTRIRLEVRDNGQGFDPAQARPGPNGIFEGLELVQRQFAAQGYVESHPGAGARVEVVFPCLADTLRVDEPETM